MKLHFVLVAWLWTVATVVGGLEVAWDEESAVATQEERRPPDTQTPRPIEEFLALRRQGRELRAAGRLDEAVATIEKALTIERQLFGEDHQYVVESLEFLAEVQESRNDYMSAKQMRERILQIRTKRFGEQDWRVAEARLALTDMEQRQELTPAERAQLAQAETSHQDAGREFAAGNSERALELEQDVLKLQCAVLGKEHLDVAVTHENLAYIHAHKKSYAAAEHHYREAVRIRRARLGTTHPRLLQLRASMADLLQARAQQQIEQHVYAETVPALSEALAIYAERYGDDDWHTREVRVAIAHVVHLMGLTSAQHQELEQCLRWKAEAIQLAGEGKYREAAELLDQTLTVCQHLLGAKDPEVLELMDVQALAAEKLADEDKAEWLFRQCATARASQLGAAHTDARQAVLRLVGFLQRSAARRETADDWGGANGRHREVLQLCTQLVGLPEWQLKDAQLTFDRAERRGNLSPEQRTAMREADQLMKRVTELQRNHQPEEALRLAQHAGDVCRQILGEQDVGYAAVLTTLASLYGDLADYARAVPLYQQAIAIRQTVLGEQHPEYAGTLDHLAEVYADIGDYARAESLYQQARAVRCAVLGRGHSDYVVSLINLGTLYQRMEGGGWDVLPELPPLAKAAFGDNHPQYANSLDIAAGLAENTGDYGAAERLYQEAITIKKATLGKQHPAYVCSLNNLAALYTHTGEFARAEPLCRQALAIGKVELGEQHPDHATTLVNLARLYVFMGDYAQAEPLLTEAIQITRYHSERTAGILTERQQLAMGQANRPYLDFHLSLLQRLPSRGGVAYQAVLGWKGMTLVRQRAARVIAEEPSLAPLFTELQQVTRQWAALVMTVPKAEQVGLFRKRREELQAEKERLEVELSRQSAVYRDAMRSVTLEELQAALPEGTALVDYLEFEHWECVDLPPVGDLGLRLEVTDEGVKITELLVGRAAARDGQLQAGDVVKSVQGADGTWTATAGRELKEIDHLLRGVPGSEVTVRVQRDGEPARDITLTRTTIPKQKRYEWKTESRLLAFVVRRGHDVQMLDLGPVAPLSAAVDTWRQTYGLRPPAEAAGRLLREKVWEPVLPALTAAKTVLVSPDGVLGRLPLGALPGKEPGTYLLEDHRLALIPVPQLLPVLVGQLDRRELEKELLLLGGVNYDHRESGEEGKQPPPTAEQLSRKPWERSRGPGEFAAGVHWNELTGTAAEIAVIKDVYVRKYYQDRPTQASEHIVELTGLAATETQFRHLAPQCYLLHVATHGFFAAPDKRSALSPQAKNEADRGLRGNIFGERWELVRGYDPGLLSGLVCAGANQPPQVQEVELWSDAADDGYLTAEEIAFLPLSGAHLVFLSACETGLGEVAGGEGMIGIQRAFQISGARSVVATLWKVNDPATQRLVQKFYENYVNEELSVLDALRETQLWALHNPQEIPRGARVLGDEENEPTTLAPYYWAAFVLSGDWR